MMVEGLIMGIDLCDDYSQISCFNPRALDAEPVISEEGKESCLISTVLCKRKGINDWLIGEAAYRCALMGEGIMVDKLIRLLEKSGSATIEGIQYKAAELFQLFLEKLLSIPLTYYNSASIASLVLTLRNKNVESMDTLISITDQLKIPRERVHITNHTESYLFYVLSQKKEIWTNQTCVFDLTKNGLDYYEMDVLRGRTPHVAQAIHVELEEGFNLEVLESLSGKKLADKILCSCADRLLDKKVISSVFLTGEGFESTDWAQNFLSRICNKRRVFTGQNLFAKGAAFLAYDYLQESTSYPYICMCEGRLASTITMKVAYEGRERQLIIAKAGSNWYESKASINFILDDADSIDFLVTPVKSPIQKTLSIPLDDFPARPTKTTRVEVMIAFTGDEAMTVRVIDKGFGEFFKGSGKMIKQEFTL